MWELLLIFLSKKNVYSVFRASPASVGFAQLSDAAGGGQTDQSSGNNGQATITGGANPLPSTGGSSSSGATSVRIGNMNGLRWSAVAVLAGAVYTLVGL